MEFHPNDWLGRWQNFESYITSTDPYLQLAWQEAEAAAAALPMFKSGAKQFWQMACVTTSIGNPHTLGGWTITPADGGKLCIAWTDADGHPLGRAVYRMDHVLERGLEGKENALFVAEDVPADWPFRCLLAMEPMPPRAARLREEEDIPMYSEEDAVEAVTVARQLGLVDADAAGEVAAGMRRR